MMNNVVNAAQTAPRVELFSFYLFLSHSIAIAEAPIKNRLDIRSAGGAERPESVGARTGYYHETASTRR